MGVVFPSFKGFISPQNKRLALTFPFFLTPLTLFSFIPKNSTHEFPGSEPEGKASPSKNNPGKIGSPGQDRDLKLHLLQRMKEHPNPDLNMEPRNIFLVSRESSGEQIGPQADSSQACNPQGKERIPQFIVPLFPYEITGKAQFLRPSGPEEYAVIFNGFGNLFVKEGDMIDPNYKLLKLYENGADVQSGSLAEFIKVETKGH